MNLRERLRIAAVDKQVLQEIIRDMVADDQNYGVNNSALGNTNVSQKPKKR